MSTPQYINLINILYVKENKNWIKRIKEERMSYNTKNGHPMIFYFIQLYPNTKSISDFNQKAKRRLLNELKTKIRKFIKPGHWKVNRYFAHSCDTYGNSYEVYKYIKSLVNDSSRHIGNDDNKNGAEDKSLVNNSINDDSKNDDID